MCGESVFRSEGDQCEGALLELGINRLARDLFLLTAVSALFILIFTGSWFRVVANRSWSKEAQVVRDAAGAQGGLVLTLHLRRDGRIQIGGHVVTDPEALTPVVQQLLRHKPALRDARVILNTYRNTPSILTSDVTLALAAAGLDPERFYLRFTEE